MKTALYIFIVFGLLCVSVAIFLGTILLAIFIYGEILESIDEIKREKKRRKTNEEKI